jgi:hypothetical protein
MSGIAGIAKTNRQYLTQLHRQAGSLVEVGEAANRMDWGEADNILRWLRGQNRN